MPAKRRPGGVLLGALALGIAVAAAIGAVRASDTADLTIDSGPARVRVAGVAATGAVAPPFDLPSLNGHTRVSLAAFRGKPVIVNFWASWCTACRAEFPLLARIHREHPDVVIVGITYKDIPFDSRRFAREHHAPGRWPMAVTPIPSAAPTASMPSRRHSSSTAAA